MDTSRNMRNNNNTYYNDVDTPVMMLDKSKYTVMEDPDMQCGFGGCHPKGLQIFANMKCFTAVYCLSGILTSVLAIFVTSQVTTLERHFGLSSSQSGFLLSCNDVGFLIMTLFVSYSARRVHIPRVLSISSAIYGLGGLICALAYVFDPYKLDRLYQTTEQNTVNGTWESHTPICRSNHILVSSDDENVTIPLITNTHCAEDQSVPNKAGLPTDYTVWAVMFIAIGMLLQGFAKSPRYPYVTTFVDDNINKTKTAMYIGLIMGVGIFGPAIAFITGGLFNTIYVTLDEVAISHRDPRWIGAWWLGFVIYSGIAIFFAVPLFFFPRHMKPNAKIDDVLKPDGKGIKQYKGVVTTIVRLLKNPVYILVVFAGNVSLLAISGTLPYAPKYLETQFSIPTWKANVLLGVIHVMAASIGTMAGGIITTKLKLHPITCIKFVIISKILSLLISGLGYVLGCSNPNIAGYNFQHNLNNNSNGTGSNWRCGNNCECQTGEYFPVCGSDGLNYFSPCVAGCTEGTNETFTNCFCIGENGTATPGLCDTNCDMLIPYLTVSFFAGFIGTIAIMPAFILQIRSVSDRDKSMAIGLASFLNTLIGWLPGPIIMGQIIDTVCEVWNTSCNQNGSCALYDIVNFRSRYVLFQVGMTFLSLILYVLSYTKARTKTDWSIDEADDNHNLPEGEKMLKESYNRIVLKECEKKKFDN